MSTGCTGAQPADDHVRSPRRPGARSGPCSSRHMPSNASATGMPTRLPSSVVDPGVERAGEAARLAHAVDDAHPAVPAHVGHRADPAVLGPGHQHRRAADVDGQVAARARAAPPTGRAPGGGRGTARRPRRRSGPRTVYSVGGDLEDVVGHVGRAVLDVVQQPPGQVGARALPCPSSTPIIDSSFMTGVEVRRPMRPR